MQTIVHLREQLADSGKPAPDIPVNLSADVRAMVTCIQPTPI